MATARILLLVNYRPEYHHQWGNKTYYTQLRLDPLGKGSAEEMLDALLGSVSPLPAQPGSGLPLPDQGEGRGVGIAALKRLIIERTEGNPFFMEEMVQALFEQGVLVRNGVVKLAKALDEIRIPPTVQAILASRIDRLSAAEKELLQTLAVLGREFSLGLIKRVAGKSDEDLERMLSELQLAEFIYEQPAFPDIEYTFKHALTQEVAYNSVLVERRKALHERVVAAIETLFSEHLDSRYPDLAHHYRRAGNSFKAVMYLRLSAEQAAARSAMNQACALLADAINLLRTLPEAPDRDRQELELQVLLASLLIARGFAIQERGETLQRAYQLCAQVEDQAQLASILFHLCQYNMGLGRFSTARELAQRALPVAEAARDPILICGAFHNRGEVCFWTGAFAKLSRVSTRRWTFAPTCRPQR
jgi:predicted ATPase